VHPAEASVDVMGKRIAPIAATSAPKTSKRQAASTGDSKAAAKHGESATIAGAASDSCVRTAAGRLKLLVDWMKEEGFRWDDTALHFEIEPEVCALQHPLR
jgi:hypothetical protein